MKRSYVRTTLTSHRVVYELGRMRVIVLMNGWVDGWMVSKRRTLKTTDVINVKSVRIM